MVRSLLQHWIKEKVNKLYLNFISLAVIKNLVKKPTFVFDKLSQNSINESKLVDTLC